MSQTVFDGRISRIRVDPAACIAAIYILLFGEHRRIFIILAAVIIHELGHLAAAYVLRIKITGIRFSLSGARIETGGIFSYKKEILLCLAGPLFNILGCIFALPLLRFNAVAWHIRTFCGACIILAVFNLLPIRDFDGGRILYSLIALFFGVRVAESVITATGCTLVAVLWITSIYMMIRYESALSLFAFSILLFFTVLTRRADQS